MANNNNSNRISMSKVMKLAWQFVKLNGFSLSEAMKQAYRNIKLRAALALGIVKFYFRKVDGTIREAYGTLEPSKLPATGGNRKTNETCQVYYDTEKQEFRCFKKANLVSF